MEGGKEMYILGPEDAELRGFEEFNVNIDL